jgi:hypothetical protein
VIGNWLVLTAGLGLSEFEAAACRVQRDAIRLPGVTKSVAVLTDDLELLAPNSAAPLGGVNPRILKGFGYWRYKSELITKAMDGYWGEFDGIIWIDAGCEINKNMFSSLYFRRMLRHAKKHGAMFFNLETPEESFTKKAVLEYFSDRMLSSSHSQIQATWFVLSGPVGKSIAMEWSFLAISRPDFFDDSESENGEAPSFVEHRNDQSVFSLICKSKQIRQFRYTPTSGPKSFKSSVRCVLHPIWNSRNRSGISIIPKYYRVFSTSFLHQLKNLS